MNKQTQEALKMAGYDLDGVIIDVEKFDGFDDVCLQTIKRVRSVISEALEQPDEYLYVYKGSDIWLKDSLDIPSAGFLIGKIRLGK